MSDSIGTDSKHYVDLYTSVFLWQKCSYTFWVLISERSNIKISLEIVQIVFYPLLIKFILMLLILYCRICTKKIVFNFLYSNTLWVRFYTFNASKFRTTSGKRETPINIWLLEFSGRFLISVNPVIIPWYITLTDWFRIQ